MEPDKIAEYRARAERCFRQSELTGDPASKLHWLAMAEGWLLLADNLGEKDAGNHFNRAA
jgi:hypothetical protein